MHSSIQPLVLLICTSAFCEAHFIPYFVFHPRSYESAVSLNNAPVDLYVRNTEYAGSEEYGVSLGGSPERIDEKRHRWTPPVPYFAHPMFFFWPTFYPMNYYGYDDLHREAQSEDADVPEETGAHSRLLEGSFAFASATADSQSNKNTAEAASFQGKISEDVIRKIFS